jgi:hypothetical protein
VRHAVDRHLPVSLRPDKGKAVATRARLDRRHNEAAVKTPRRVQDTSAWKAVLVQRHEHRKAPVAVLPPRHPRYEPRIVPPVAAVRPKGRLLSEARRPSCKVQLPPSPQTPYDVLPTFADHHDRHRHKRARTRDNSNDLQRRGGRDQGRWRYNGRYQIKRQKCSFCPRLSPPLYPPLQWTTQGPSPSTRGLSNPNSGRGLKHQATSNRPHRRPLTPPTPSQRPFAHLHRTYHNGYRQHTSQHTYNHTY